MPLSPALWSFLLPAFLLLHRNQLFKPFFFPPDFHKTQTLSWLQIFTFIWTSLPSHTTTQIKATVILSLNCCNDLFSDLLALAPFPPTIAFPDRVVRLKLLKRKSHRILLCSELHKVSLFSLVFHFGKNQSPQNGFKGCEQPDLQLSF